VPTSESKAAVSPDTGGKLTLLRALASRNIEIAKVRDMILFMHKISDSGPLCTECGTRWPCRTVLVVCPDLPNPSPPL
jgi:hypothetical protein